MRTALIFIAVFLIGSTIARAQLATDTTGGPDGFGHRWITSHAPGETIDFEWLDARTGIRLNLGPGDGDSFRPIGVTGFDIGFTFNYKGNNYSEIWVSTGGFISFDELTAHYEDVNNDGIPNSNLPNNILAAGWDQLDNIWITDESDIYYRTIGSAPYRKFVVEWYDFAHEVASATYTFQIVLYETTNLIVFNYLDLTGDSLNTATIGIEDSVGTIITGGLEFANNSIPAVQDSMSILFFGDQVTGATIDISPDTIETGAAAQEFQ